MQELKIRYNGQFLMMRYLCSTLPGEMAFSLIFSSLSFSAGKSLYQLSMIVLTLAIVKVILSIVFSIFIVPITYSIKLFCTHSGNDMIEYIPFT